MKRSQPLKRTPLRPGQTTLKVRRVSKRFAKRRDPEYCRWIRTLPCASPPPYLLMQGGKEAGYCRSCAGPVECAHVRSRGAGGDDRGNTVPLCRRHHRQQHSWGIESFSLFYAVNLPAIAAQLATEYAALVSPPQEDET